MKKINLNDTWRLCLQMWKWIAKKKIDGSRAKVAHLKVKWLKEHGFKKDSIVNTCFFCHYDAYDAYCGDNCNNCPGKKIDPNFHCALNVSYRWDIYPAAFCEKIAELNRKRRKR